MILLKISDSSEKKIEQIAHDLLTLNLVLDVNISSSAVRVINKENGLSKHPITLLTAKTKALLFTTINDRIKEIWKANLPEIYSVPIINMDWKQSRELTTSLKKV